MATSEIGELTFQAKAMLATAVPSVAVTTGAKAPPSSAVPAAIVPLMTPVEVLMLSPLGRPDTVQVNVAPEVASDPLMWKLITSPSLFWRLPSCTRLIGELMLQSKVALALAVPSLTTTNGRYEP
jgi:hypothetical protein